NWLNHYLGAEGTTLETGRRSRQKLGSDKAMQSFVEELLAGKIDGVVFAGANPVYDLPNGEEIAKAIKSLSFSASLASREDETSAAVQFVSPASHWLESWGDAEKVEGWAGVVQPAVEKTAECREDS